MPAHNHTMEQDTSGSGRVQHNIHKRNAARTSRVTTGKKRRYHQLQNKIMPNPDKAGNLSRTRRYPE